MKIPFSNSTCIVRDSVTVFTRLQLGQYQTCKGQHKNSFWASRKKIYKSGDLYNIIMASTFQIRAKAI